MVQALPVLRLLKRHWPESVVYWFIDSNLAPLLEGDPQLAGLVYFHRRRWAEPRRWPEILRMVRWLRAQQFDLVIDLQTLMRTGVFGWLANGKLSIGMDEAREGARGFYDHVVRRPSARTHAVDWYLGVLPLVGAPVDGEFEWLPERKEVQLGLRRNWPIDGARWVVIQPGARWVNKRWPAEHYGALVRQLSEARPDVRFAVLGGAEDQALGETVSRGGGERCLNLAGKVSLPEMVEWIRLCDLMITNDTGPMHVAAALRKPVVALFGPTEPRRTGPYGQLEHVLQLSLPCVPCMNPRCRYEKPFECLRALRPEAAVVAAERRLSTEILPLATPRGGHRVAE